MKVIDFAQKFSKDYENLVKNRSRSMKLNDIQQAINDITPGKLGELIQATSNSQINSAQNNIENGKTYLYTAKMYLYNYLLEKASVCNKTKQNKLYSSCLIISIIDDKDLSILSEILEFQLPKKLTKEEINMDKRSKKELLSLLPKFLKKGSKFLSKRDLLILLSDTRIENYESDIIKFYLNILSANNKNNYYFSDIVSWDDYNLETKDDYICWLFPQQNEKYFEDNIFNEIDIKEFNDNIAIRTNIVKATQRMMLFYGFAIKDGNVKEVLPLNRREKGMTIGLFSSRNYDRITRILKFLVLVNMEELSALFLLALCNAISTNPKLKKKIEENNYLEKWVQTQPFLQDSNIYKKEESDFDLSSFVFRDEEPEEEESIFSEWELDWDSEPEIEEWEDEDEDEGECNIKALRYNSNSCYMDSTLISLLAIPNKVITESVLNKNLDALKEFNILWSRYSDNIDVDIERRKRIQQALNQIAKSMRTTGDVKNCVMFRKIISKCPGSQEFHGGETQDAGEFLSYLFNIFQVNIATTVRKTYGTNDLGPKPKWILNRKIIDPESSPIVDVVSTLLQQVPKDYDISNFMKKKEYSEFDQENKWYPDKKNKPDLFYIRKKEIFKTTDSPYIVFNINRTYGEPQFTKPTKNKPVRFKGIKNKTIWKRLTVPETINIKDNQLELTAIVVHTGGAHYVTNFKCDGIWYWYDDNPIGSTYIIKNIGSFQDMIKTNPKPLSHGTLFFYT